MKIYAPNKAYTGISAGVSFINGVGETKNTELRRWFKDHGYTVEDEEVANEGMQEDHDQEESHGQDDEVKHDQVQQREDTSKQLEEMTKPELEEVANAYGVEYNSRTSKGELIKLIKVKAGYLVEEE